MNNLSDQYDYKKISKILVIRVTEGKKAKWVGLKKYSK